MQTSAPEWIPGFDNSFVRELPGDPEADNFRRQVLGACYSRVEPTPVSGPELLGWSREVAALLGLPEDLQEDPQEDPQAEATREELAAVLSGSRLWAGMEPYAACYGGHQFGNWADQLGDGRAITLGEILRSNDGEDTRWELQLKGAGPTPYSRRGDGRAVLRSSIREFLCSEAMHHLGVPTTRALSLVRTGDEVRRDMFYDGNAELEPGAVVCRVAPSFVRFGNFELFAARKDHETLRRLADYVIAEHFPELDAGDYAAWFGIVAERTAEMICHWMRVGFVHGVMNTDNMSVLGLTIDYGPYGWLEDYDPNWTPNTTDAHGRRYRFGNQPRIAAWNLTRFGAALLPLVDEAESIQAGLEAYAERLSAGVLSTYADKLGLRSIDADEGSDQPGSGPWLANTCMDVLRGANTKVETDMTIFHRQLAEVPMDPEASDEAVLAPLRPAYYGEYDRRELPPKLRELTLRWLRGLQARVRSEGLDPNQRRAIMDGANPKYVLRNYLAQEAIDLAEAGDPSRIHELLELLRRPYTDQPGKEHFAGKRPEWARHRPGCSMLSCSS
ncbi:hypothetical protein PPSIR1_34502 [Plesiocystis pacifica SIR-1]|uniref:Protein nucleotidyltransferase YdiU n=1 Tax=Plesiocystis pacifica SIR-1 TaxID=391625 RepID=A6G7Q8_9BACT|nr:YdiU family protein [Plesiocystis pacifica]EDM78136.1 hypothetical protein PPSIR1_34502 [Plesiocystis pacifica SIR-1]